VVVQELGMAVAVTEQLRETIILEAIAHTNKVKIKS